MLTFPIYNARICGGVSYEIVSRGTSPQTKHATLWACTEPLRNNADKPVGDHYMFDGSVWSVGSRNELVDAFNNQPQ